MSESRTTSVSMSWMWSPICEPPSAGAGNQSPSIGSRRTSTARGTSSDSRRATSNRRPSPAVVPGAIRRAGICGGTRDPPPGWICGSSDRRPFNDVLRIDTSSQRNGCDAPHGSSGIQVDHHIPRVKSSASRKTASRPFCRRVLQGPQTDTSPPFSRALKDSLTIINPSRRRCPFV